VEGRQLASEQDFAPEKIISEEPGSEEMPDLAQYADLKYNEQLMAESMPDDDLPSMPPRKGPSTEAGPEGSAQSL
jgi:hypothetical protein